MSEIQNSVEPTTHQTAKTEDTSKWLYIIPSLVPVGLTIWSVIRDISSGYLQYMVKSPWFYSDLALLALLVAVIVLALRSAPKVTYVALAAVAVYAIATGVSMVQRFHWASEHSEGLPPLGFQFYLVVVSYLVLLATAIMDIRKQPKSAVSEAINSAEPAVAQTAKKRNWCGIIGFGCAMAAFIVLAIMANYELKSRITQEDILLGSMGHKSSQVNIMADAYSSAATVFGFLAVDGILLLAGLILSIIGLFFKPKGFATAGLVAVIATVGIFICIGLTHS